MISLGLIIVLVELVAWAGLKCFLPDYLYRNVQVLSGAKHFTPHQLPNAFWHHDNNPEKGIANEQGVRGDLFEMPKPEGQLRVICIGNSTVEGFGVEDKETFPYFLEQLLNGSLDSSVGMQSARVINAGISSHNSAFNLSYLAFRLIHFQPDVVIIKSAYNDYLPYIVPGMGYDYTHAFPTPFYFRENSAGYWKLARFSNTLKLLGVVLFKEEVMNPNQHFTGVMTSGQFKQMDYAQNEDKFFLFKENIRSMILLCKGRGIHPVLLDLPVSSNDSHYEQGKFGERFRTLVSRLEQELQQVALEESVPLIRTASHLNDEHFWDHCHNTPEGNRQVAKAIHDRWWPNFRSDLHKRRLMTP